VDIVSAVASGIVAPAELELLKATAKLEKRKEAVTPVLSGLQLVLRDAMAARSGAATRLSTDPDAAAVLARQLTGRQLLDMLGVIEELQLSRHFNMNHTLFITALCARLRRAAGR
jgi:DNA polymerase-3 subunit delta'